MNLNEKITSKISLIKSSNRFRTLKEPYGIDLSSNDYLGLSKHPELLEALKNGIEFYGGGSTSSRLIRGHRDIFYQLENHFSEWVHAGSSLFLSNGFLANLGLIDSLCDKDTIILADRLCHASILDGIRLSKCEVRYFKHLDMTNLENLLNKYINSKNIIVITETIFSMDGDKLNLDDLIFLKRKYNFSLILDEAHALGIFGFKGSGITNSLETKYSDEVDFRIFTCGKSMGLEGAFISCKKEWKDYLINTLRTFIFSTAPLPATAFALIKSIELIKAMDKERLQMIELSKFFRDELIKMNFNLSNSTSHIIPIIIDDEVKTMTIANNLQEKGYDIRGIRPPTVKESRLRININSKINKEILTNLLKELEEQKNQYLINKE